MNKPTSVVLAVVLLGLLSVLAAAERQASSAPAYVEKATGLAFPGRIGLLVYGGTEEYEDASLGVSVRYSADGITGTVYVYNAGLPAVPSGAASPVHKDVVAAAVEEIREVSGQGYYRDLVLGPETVMELAGRGHRARHVSLAYSIEGVRWHSHILVLGLKNRLVKLRFSYLDEFRTAGEEQLKALTAWLDGAVDRLER